MKVKVKCPILAILIVTLMLAGALMQPALASASPPTSMTRSILDNAAANMVQTLWNPTLGAFKCAPAGEPWNYWVDDQGKTLELISQTPSYWSYGSQMADFIAAHTTASGSVIRRTIETKPTVLNGLPVAFDIQNRLLRMYGDLTKSRQLSFKVLYMPQGTMMAYLQGNKVYDGVQDYDLSIGYDPTGWAVTSGTVGGLEYARATQIWDLTNFKLQIDYTLWEDKTYLQLDYSLTPKVNFAQAKVQVPLDQLDWLGPTYGPGAPHLGYGWVWIPGYPDQQSNDTEQQHFLPNPAQWNTSWYMVHMHGKPDSVSSSLAIVADWGTYKSLVTAVDNSLLGEAIPGSQRYSPNLHWLKQYADLGPTLAGVTKKFTVKYYFLDAHDWTNLDATYREIFSTWDLTKTDPSQLYQYGAVVFGLAKMFQATRDLKYLELLKKIWYNWNRMFTTAGTWPNVSGTYMQSLPYMLRAMLLMYQLGADPTMQPYFDAAITMLRNKLLEAQEMNPIAANYGGFKEWEWYWPGTANGLTEPGFEAFTNILTNPGFETGALTPWVFTLVDGSGAAIVSDAGNAHSGSKAANVTSSTGGNDFYLNQTFSIPAGTGRFFTNSFWVKANVTGYSARVELVQKDAAGGIMLISSNAMLPVTSTYQQIIYPINLASNTASVTFRMRVSGTVAGASEVWFDDAVSGSLGPWFFHVLAGSGDIVVEDSGNAHSGNYAAKVISPSGTVILPLLMTNHFFINQSMKIEGMSTQTFSNSWWVKANVTGYIAKVEILQRGEAGQIIRLDGSPGVPVNSTWGQVPPYSLQMDGLTASVEWRMWVNGPVSEPSEVWFDDAVSSSAALQYWGNSYEDYTAPAMKALADYYLARDNSTMLSRITAATNPWHIADGTPTYQYPVWDPIHQIAIYKTVPQGYIVHALTSASTLGWMQVESQQRNAQPIEDLIIPTVAPKIVILPGPAYDWNWATYKSAMITQAWATGLNDLGYDKPIALKAVSWLWAAGIINSTDTFFATDQTKTETNTETEPWGVIAWTEWMEAASALTGPAQMVLAALQSSKLMNVTSLTWSNYPFPKVYAIGLEIPAGETVQVWVTSHKEITGIYVNGATTYTYVWDPPPPRSFALISITVPTTGSYVLQVGYPEGYDIHVTYPCFRLTWTGAGGVKNMTGFEIALNKHISIMNSSRTGFDLRWTDPYWTILANDTDSGLNEIWACYDKPFGWVFSNAPMPSSVYGQQTLKGKFTLSGPMFTGSLHVKVDTGIFDYGPRMTQLEGLTAPYGNGTYWNYRYELIVQQIPPPMPGISYGQIIITWETTGPGSATIIIVAIVAVASAGVIYVARKKIKR